MLHHWLWSSGVNQISKEFHGKNVDEHLRFQFLVYWSLDQISAHLPDYAP